MELLLEETEPAATRRGKLAWVTTALFALAAAVVSFLYFRERPQERPVARFTILPPEKTSFRFDVQPYGLPALSPDGRRLVFGARSEDGTSRLWVRSLDSMTAQPLAGTEGASFSFPFWSPDGRSVGFGAEGKLKRIELSGGPAVTLAIAAALRGGSWSPRGVILFAPSSNGPLQRIPAAGGPATPVTALDPVRRETWHRCARRPAFPLCRCRRQQK